MTSTNTNKEPIKRRSFLRKIWVGIGIIAGLELVYIIFNFLQPKNTANNILSENYFEAGLQESFKKNSITSFRNRNFFLCRSENGEFHALSARCTHLGCALSCNTEKNLLECPCHSSMFDINGKVLRSPASKSLPKHKVIIEKGIVKVNTSNVLSSNAVDQNKFLV